MFKFNFSQENDEKDPKTSSSEAESIKLLKSERYMPENEEDDVIKDIFTNCEEVVLDLGIKYFSTGHIMDILRSNEDCESVREISALSADECHSDLQNGVYEGGLKIWECTFDLLNHIQDLKLNLKNKKVLDLGCGAGLIGIFSLLKEASKCTFQDYNLEVLKFITVPNLKLNSEDFLTKSDFYSGDWGSFSEHLSEKFDFIFTSETIYNTECYEKLHSTFERLLEKDGAIFLAAKSYYFGVGGGTTLFQEFLTNKNVFKCSTSWSCSEGLKRDILKITFR